MNARTHGLSRRALLRGGLLAGAATLALGATPSIAQGPAPQPVRPVGGSGQAPTPLAHAVRVAEKQTGGRARKAETGREKGGYVYEIKTGSKDGAATVLGGPVFGDVPRGGTPGVIASIAKGFHPVVPR